ncbi:unnamed protein product [Diamesa hyperborea]
MAPNLINVCRLCLVKSSVSSEEIFFPIDNGFQDKFQQITNISLSKVSEDFPKHMCITCCTELEKNFDYRNGLVEKQKRLHSMLGSVCEIMEIKQKPVVELKDAFTQCEVETTNTSSQIELETTDASTQAFETNPMKSQSTQYEPLEIIEVRTIKEQPEIIDITESQETEEEVYDSEPEYVYAEEVNESYCQSGEIEQFQVEFIDEENENGHESEKEEETFKEEDGDEAADDSLMEYIEYDEVAEEQTLEAEYYYEDIDKEIELIDESGDEQVIESKNLTKRTKNPQVRRRSNKDPKDSAEYTFKCWVETCNSAFTFRSSMKRHLKTVHSLEVSSSTCMICGLPFKVYHDYLSHIKTHTRKFECDLCKLTFVSSDRLESHSLKFHKPTDERPFVCTICDASFKRKEHLKSHRAYKHSDGERKFSCTHCEGMFYSRQDLKSHSLVHSGAKKYACPVCKFECKDLKTLKRHTLNKHSTLEVWVCNICEDKFEQHRDYKVHMKNEHCSGSGST